MKQDNLIYEDHDCHAGPEDGCLACVELAKMQKSPDECPECGTLMHTQQESRDGGYFELVTYCEGCGYTATER